MSFLGIQNSKIYLFEFFFVSKKWPNSAVKKYLRDPLISAVKLFVENNKTIMLNEKQNEQPKWKRVFKQKWTKQKEKRSSKWM